MQLPSFKGTLNSSSWILAVSQSCKSGRILRVKLGFGFGLKFVEKFQAISGLHAVFSQWRTLVSPFTDETIELIKSSLKMITYELFSHVYFATPPVSLSCAYLDLLVKFGLQGLNRASKINVKIRLALGSCFRDRSKFQNSARLQLCCFHPFPCVFFFCWQFYNVCHEKSVRFQELAATVFDEKGRQIVCKVDNQLFNKLNIHLVSFLPLFCFKSLRKWLNSVLILCLKFSNFFWKSRIK